METLHLIPNFLKLKVEALRSHAEPSAGNEAGTRERRAATRAVPPTLAGLTAQPIAPKPVRRAEQKPRPRRDEGAAIAGCPGLPAFDTHWLPSLLALGAAADGREAFERLRSDYQDRARHYHTLTQVGECLERLSRWQAFAEAPHELAMAIWFKDAVLDPRRHDNEGRSARLAYDTLIGLGVDAEIARRVRDLIVVTRCDGPPAAADARMMADIDMGILGAEPTRYAEFERQLRDEMGHVTDFIYRRRRVEGLKAMLARLHIFHTDAGRVELEREARTNLQGTVQKYQGRGLVQAA